MGQIIGTPGGSLQNSGGWASSQSAADAGRRGELLTAEALHAVAFRPNGPTVLHDLRIPAPGVWANIDHVVVSGKRVTILDSKVWSPGFYWTFGARTRQGWSLAPKADKRTLPMAAQALTKLLDKRRLGAHCVTAVIVWPTRMGAAPNLRLYRPAGHALRASGHWFQRNTDRIVGASRADPLVVAALSELVIGG